MAEQDQQEPRQRGRPRSEASHQAVLEAAVSLLQEKNVAYQELTVEKIAAEASVSKQTIYRWWPSKAEVVLEAVLTGRLVLNSVPVPHTDDLRADLRTWLQEAFEQECLEDMTVLARNLVAAMASSSARTRALLPGGSIWNATDLVDRIRAAQVQGQVRESVDPVRVVSALMDPLVMQMVTMGPPDPEWMFQGVDMLMAGVLRKQ